MKRKFTSLFLSILVSLASTHLVAASGIISAETGGYINVLTDTFDIQINLTGGDIEYLAFPSIPINFYTPEQPFVAFENNVNRHFIAQSGLAGPNGPDSQERRPVYTTTKKDFFLTGDTLNVDLFIDQNGVRYRKTFGFQRGEYVIDVSYTIENNTDSDWVGNIFGQFKRDNTPDPTSPGGIIKNPYRSFARTTADTRFEKITFEMIDNGVGNYSNTGGWIAFVQHYFVSAWVPNKSDIHTFYLKTASNNQYRGGFVAPNMTVQPRGIGKLSARIYAGPKNKERLALVAENLELSVESEEFYEQK